MTSDAPLALEHAASRADVRIPFTVTTFLVAAGVAALAAFVLIALPVDVDRNLEAA
jgi:hypothetical protein